MWMLARQAGSVLCLLAALSLLSGVNTATAADVIPTHVYNEFYSLASQVDREPIPVGAIVAVFDPDRVQCGEFVVTGAGTYGLAACYGDDPGTPVDEGALTGDRLSFSIDGRAAATTAVSVDTTIVPPDTAVIFRQGRVLWEVDLDVTVEPLEPIISQETLDVTLDWRHTDPAVLNYEVWRSDLAALTPGADLVATLPPAPSGLMMWADSDSPEMRGSAFYKIRSRDSGGGALAISGAVGQFVFSIVP